MTRCIDAIVADIDGLGGDLDLDRLDALAVEFFAERRADVHARAWYRFYERFPEGDGFGVFWSILHGLEAQSGDHLVVESVRRAPAEFPVRMVNRLLNAGISEVGGVDLLALLGEVAANPACPPRVREEAEAYLAYQASR